MDCLRRNQDTTVGRNLGCKHRETLSLWNRVKSGASAIMAPSSPTLLAEVIAIQKAIFMERRDMEQEARGSKGEVINAMRPRLRSPWGVKD